MEYGLLGILAVLVAMISNYAGPKFYTSKFGTRFQGNYAMRTAGTAIVIFVAILLATVVIEAATREVVKLPNPV